MDKQKTYIHFCEIAVIATLLLFSAKVCNIVNLLPFETELTSIEFDFSDPIDEESDTEEEKKEEEVKSKEDQESFFQTSFLVYANSSQEVNLDAIPSHTLEILTPPPQLF